MNYKRFLIFISILLAALAANSQPGEQNLNCPEYTKPLGGAPTALNRFFSYETALKSMPFFKIVGGEEKFNSLFAFNYQVNRGRKGEKFYSADIATKGPIELEFGDGGFYLNLTPCLSPDSLALPRYTLQRIDRFLEFNPSFNRVGFDTSLKACFDAVIPYAFQSRELAVNRLLTGFQPFYLNELKAALQKNISLENSEVKDSLISQITASTDIATWLVFLAKYKLDVYQLLYEVGVRPDANDSAISPDEETRLLRVFDFNIDYFFDLIQFIQTGSYNIHLNSQVMGLRFPKSVLQTVTNQDLIAKVCGKYTALANTRSLYFGFDTVDLPKSRIAGTQVELSAQKIALLKNVQWSFDKKEFTLLRKDSILSGKTAHYSYDEYLSKRAIIEFKNGALTFHDSKDYQIAYTRVILNSFFLAASCKLPSLDGKTVLIKDKKGNALHISTAQLTSIFKRSKLDTFSFQFDAASKLMYVEFLQQAK